MKDADRVIYTIHHECGQGISDTPHAVRLCIRDCWQRPRKLIIIIIIIIFLLNEVM